MHFRLYWHFKHEKQREERFISEVSFVMCYYKLSVLLVMC